MPAHDALDQTLVREAVEAALLAVARCRRKDEGKTARDGVP